MGILGAIDVGYTSHIGVGIGQKGKKNIHTSIQVSKCYIVSMTNTRVVILICTDMIKTEIKLVSGSIKLP